MSFTSTIEFQSFAPPRDQIRVRTTPLSVVSVGRDKDLLYLRERAIISRSDLRVRSLSPEEGEAAARNSGAHLWIFCGSIELRKLVLLASSVRRSSPTSRLLLVRGYRRSGFEDSLFHWIVQSSDGVESFLDAVSLLAVGP